MPSPSTGYSNLESSILSRVITSQKIISNVLAKCLKLRKTMMKFDPVKNDVKDKLATVLDID